MVLALRHRGFGFGGRGFGFGGRGFGFGGRGFGFDISKPRSKIRVISLIISMVTRPHSESSINTRT